MGALSNNGVGIAGMSWGAWILPVRALGKGGGYDSDIIAGIEWAAGLSVVNPDGPPVPAESLSRRHRESESRRRHRRVHELERRGLRKRACRP